MKNKINFINKGRVALELISMLPPLSTSYIDDLRYNLFYNIKEAD